METPNIIKRNLYYTHDHEWIDFQGSVAYVGVCSFKLSGIREIHNINLNELSNMLNPGEVICSIQFDDYLIKVHMPVEGKIISFNDLLLTEERNVLLLQPENNGWIALVAPSNLNDKAGLLSPEEYQLRQTKY
ncbi:hypothetical protein FAM09_30475 [Niastella caeni]|uniref:Glycine cleavage system protein H n=1 Tax=Niastella caeni TaxID=2569763 RepID=A0A4S8H8B9_9BACT|nr:hypothetical protein [Niastella caeni]THU30229.1 hypothetical protein FAM09_30475 [Niastella caeni]